MKTQQRSSLADTLHLRFNVTKIQKTLTKLGLASTAAAIAETVTFPIDLTKTRLQIQGEKSGWGGPKRGMFQVAWGVIRDEGAFKLWRGVKPAVIRHIFYSGFRVTLYEFIREHVLKKDADGQFALYKCVIAAATAGVISQMVCNPMDLIKVRFQTDGARQLQGYKPRYRGVYHAIITIVREEGVLKLWRGVVPSCQRAGLVALGDFATYDTTKRKLLLHTTFKDNVTTHLVSSALAGLAATTLGTPADVVKSRIMNQPIKDGKGVLYSSSVDCLVKSVRNEGLFSLYKGFFPSFARLGPWSITFWLIYEKLRSVCGVETF